MAGEWLEPWDFYADLASAQSKGWNLLGEFTTDDPDVGIQTYRQTGNASGNFSWRALSADRDVVYFGADFVVEDAYPATAAQPVWLISFADSAQNQLGLRINVDGQLEVARGGNYGAAGGTVLWVDDGPHPLGSHDFLELGAKIHATAGWFVVRRNGLVVVSMLDVNTQETANAYANRVGFAADNGGTDFRVGSNYCNNAIDAGDGFNTFLGPGKARTMMPDGDVGTPGFTPSSGGVNYAMVDELPTDGDTTRITATGAAVSEFTLSNLPATVDGVRGVEVFILARKSDAGAATYRGILSSTSGGGGATVVNGPTEAPGTANVWNSHFQVNIDPDTGAAFTPANLNSNVTLKVERLT